MLLKHGKRWRQIPALFSNCLNKLNIKNLFAHFSCCNSAAGVIHGVGSGELCLASDLALFE